MKRKVLSFVLALCLALFPAACSADTETSSGGGPEETSSLKTESGASKEDVSRAESSGGETDAGTSAQALTVPAHVQAAIDASGHLTTGEYFLAQDGSILCLDEPSSGGDIYQYCTAYAALPKVKKLVESCSSFDLFALTESGELYYRDTKVLDGVRDMVYKTNNVNECAYAVTADNLYRVTVQKTAKVNETLRADNPERYTDVGEDTVCCAGTIFVDNFVNQGKTTSGPFASISAARSDFSVVTADGKIYRALDFPEEYESTPSVCSWDDVVLFDARKNMLSSFGDDERESEVSAAAILADGSVVAEGTYAEEILSWGELSYISLADPVVAGLKPDGTLKIAGAAVQEAAEEVGKWKDIVAVKASTDGSDSETGVVSAMDKNGDWFYIRFSSEGTIYDSFRLSPSEGIVAGKKRVFKFTPDGGVYVADGDSGGWEAYEVE